MDFNKDVLQASKKGAVLMDFYADWCGPCRMIKPSLSLIERQRKNFSVVYVDVDKHRELARMFGIRSIPTLVLFKDGINVATRRGGGSKVSIDYWIDEVLSPEEPVVNKTTNGEEDEQRNIKKDTKKR